MLIAHLPAGYLLADRFGGERSDRTWLIATGLMASILPDLDLLWFYLMSDRRSVHHDFVFHWPLFWVAVALVVAVMAWVARQRRALPFIVVALACLLLHMALDSIAAGIGWLRPFSDAQVNLVVVPAGRDWWVWNFVLHWTFLLELAICLWAGVVLWRNWRVTGRA